MSDISKFYAGRTVLITGSTGFMGKVLLERMLCTLLDIKKIYLLLRPKRGLTIEERINLMLTRVPFTFNNIPGEQFAKVSGIHGDFSNGDLSLLEEDKEKIINEVSVVIHMAASVRFDIDLKSALKQNTLATKLLLDFCTQIKKLSSVVYVSTTFCNIDIAHSQERVYDIENINVYEILDLINSDSDSLTRMTKDIIKPHPNTYTFSKRLAEIVARDMSNKLPLCIVRPSIVFPAQSKPCKGWIDNLNGPIGILSAVAAGVLRVSYTDANNKPDVVPVDCVINGIIAASWNRTLQKSTDKIVYNLTLHEKNKFTLWKYLSDTGILVFRKYPLKRILWYPRAFPTNKYFIYALITIFCQVVPAIILDTLLVIFQQKPFLLNVQKKLYNANDIVCVFSRKAFSFDTKNTENLFNSLGPEDHKIFYGINGIVLDYEYFKNAWLCVRAYCFNDDGKSSFRYVLLKMLFVMDAFFQMTVIYGIVFVIFRLFGVTKFLELNYWF